MSRYFPWDDTSRARMKHLYLVDGLSAGLVADALAKEFSCSVSRSAVIGALHRLNIKRPTTAKPRVEKDRVMPPRKARPLPPPGSKSMVEGEVVTARQPKTRAEKKRDGRPAFSQLTGLRIGTSTTPGYFPPEPAAPSPRRLTLMELTASSCRWPVTPAAPFFFCGHRVEAGSQYCSDHHVASRARDQARAVKGLEAYAKAFGGGA